jgi:hypothetical protein
MAGLKELHVQDPETWPAERLSETFGVSYEAVKRVLRSNYRRESDVPANLMPASAAAARKPKKPDGAHGLGPAFPPPPGTSKWDKSVQPSASASASASTQASTWAPAAVPNTAKWDKANFTGPVGRRFALASPAERVQRTYALKRQVEAEGGAGAGPEQEQELAELKGFREPAERRELAELRDLREPQERRGSWESRGPEARSRRVERPQFERSSFERTHRAREREPRDVNARRRGSSFGLRKD